MDCQNCGNEINGKFCSNCGKPIELERLDFQYVKKELGSVLFLEKGFFFTIKELIFRPDKSVKEFLLYDRKRLVKPFVFIILTSLAYALVIHYFSIDDGYIQIGAEESTSWLSKMGEWISSNYGYTNIIISTFTSFWLWWFFRKKGYNFFEIIVLLCFVLGVFMLTLAIFSLISYFTHLNLTRYAFYIPFIYIIWAIGRFFGGHWINYLKSFMAYFLGLLSFALTTVIIGLLLDRFF